MMTMSATLGKVLKLDQGTTIKLKIGKKRKKQKPMKLGSIEEIKYF